MKLVGAYVFFRLASKKGSAIVSILRSYYHWAAEGEGTTARWSYGRTINAYRCKLMISSYCYDYKWVVMIILKIVMMIILWCLLLGVVTCCYLVLWTLWSCVEKLVATWS
jgi:hypothetical protein